MAKSPHLMEGELTINYEKSPHFRVIHVDGAVGGMAPATDNIHMSVFSERHPIPKRVVHSMSRGIMGAEMIDRREIRDGVFREVEADLVLALDVAIALRTWLDERIREVLQSRVNTTEAN